MNYYGQFILFDCDGVIIDSNQFKQTTFEKVICEYDHNLVREFIEFSRKNGGLSRVHKFRYFFERILKLEKTEAAILTKRKVEEFHRYCSNQLVSLDLTNGFRNYIESLHIREIPSFIISGGNREEINSLLKYHRISHMFAGIFGNEQTKISAIKQILTNYNFQTKKGIFYGDSKLDGIAANQFGIPFVFVSNFSDVTLNDLSDITIARCIDNFSDISC